MKVVINTCFGGFGVSPAGIVHYLKLKGLPCFFYKQTKYSFQDGKDLYELAELKDVIDEMFSPYVSTKNLGKSFSEWPKHNEGYFYYGDLERNDPLLVQTVEELGSKIASSKLGELKVIEIPDGTDWQIEEYDGLEHIAERHNTWN